MAFSLSLNIVQNSQNIANNTSNVTVSVIATWTAPHWNGSGLCPGSITIDGTTYNFSGITFNTSQTSSGSQILMTKDVDVQHSADGSKLLVCSAYFDTRITSGSINRYQYADKTQNLTTIARKAELTNASSLSLELGIVDTLRITRVSQDIRRYITYSCGTKSGVILNETRHISASSPEGKTESGDVTKVIWEPPESLAAVVPTSDYANITLTVHSYFDDGRSDDGSDSKDLGSNKYTLEAYVTDRIGPKITDVTVTEGGDVQILSDILYYEYDNAYGFMQYHSVLNVKITATGDDYGSTIKKYSTTIGGVTYSGSEFTVTDTSKLSGDVIITTTVTDNRGSSGRTATDTKTVTFAPYAKPKITSFTAVRANSDGSKNSNGNYILAKFSGTYNVNVGPGFNSYILIQYREVNTSTWNTINAVSTNGTFLTGEASGGEFSYSVLIGEVTESRHEVKFEFNDYLFTSATQTIEVPSTAPIMHFNASGNGIGFGKVAELDNVFDVAFQTKFNRGINALCIYRNQSDTTDTTFDTKLDEMYDNLPGGSITPVYFADRSTSGLNDGRVWHGFICKTDDSYGYLIASAYCDSNTDFNIAYRAKHGVWKSFVKKTL